MRTLQAFGGGWLMVLLPGGIAQGSYSGVVKDASGAVRQA